MMGGFLALLAFLAGAGVAVEHVHVPAPGGVTLDAALVRPAVPRAVPAVVALHGCAGPWAGRDGPWAVELSRLGHTVLLPDSFGSRGLGPQCREKVRAVRPGVERRADAIAAARWLDAGPVVILGWSNGGQTALAVAREAADLPPGLIARVVAFYPGCRSTASDPGWRPVAPLLILVGEADDWTPAAPCRPLAQHFPDRVTLVTYPGAYHDFDAAERPVRELRGLATTPDGTAHAGTDPAARADALVRVPAFLDGR